MSKRSHRLTSRRSVGNGVNGRQLPTPEPECIPLRHLELWLDDWLSDCEVAQFSRRTIEGRRVAADRLLRFLREQDETECGVRQLRKFFGWLRAPDGNINAMRRNKAKALSHNTIATYYERLQTFYNWLTERRLIEASPFDELPIVQRKDEEIRILSPQQVEQLLRAAKRGRHGMRDKAILLLMYDTGLRVTELCTLKYGTLDLTGRTARILGKGNKHRTVDFSIRTARALYDYLRYKPRQADDPVFLTGKSGAGSGEAMTRDNVRHAFYRWAKRAGLRGVRISPHTVRHSFATEYMRNGGSEKCLQRMLGHTDLQMTHHYTEMAHADTKAEHRRCSPVDKLTMREE